MAVEPAPTAWAFPSADDADGDGLVGVGADLEPGTILAAYRRGLFPMPIGRRGTLGWWSPDPRAVIPLDRLRVSRSLRRSARRFEIRVDTAFTTVIHACSDPLRPHGWISPEVRAAYLRLHRLGWAHSVEAWSLDDGELAGGLYGLAIGGLFAGESMFHRRTDASKVALVALVDLLRATEGAPSDRGESGPTAPRVLDVQWLTPHLRSLGAVEIARSRYLELVRRAIELPLPPAFAG
jgi:leucyl/phenylalanyl-tRNA--protein transferase